MTRKSRIAAALAAPVVGSLAFVGLAAAPAAPAGAVSPITITSHNITVIIPPVLYLSISY
ncbi:MAG TPA: hypothetical protein VNG12_24400 [Acidimicrobiales bacterium]|nr:hypothetical protein [Acidimicrobiales bacterium]